MSFNLRSSVFFLLTFVCINSFAQRPIPALSNRPVIDESNILNLREVELLSNQLKNYLSIAQIQVWIVDSLEDEPIESLSIRAVEQWKLGSTSKDNGALILVALNDRKMRIEVGQGLEGDVPDVIAARILDHIIAPAFRAGQYYGGLSTAAQEIYVLAGGKGEKTLTQNSTRKLNFFEIIFFLFLVIFILISRFFGGGRYYGGSGFSGGSWSGGGGGSWSGGGGGFSGGGSSGSW